MLTSSVWNLGSMFTVVLDIELGLLTISLKASSVFPFNNSDSVGSVGLCVWVGDVGELGATVEITVVAPASTRFEVLLSVVSETCSVLMAGTVKSSALGDGLLVVLSAEFKIVAAVVLVIELELADRVEIKLLGLLVVVILLLFKESELTSNVSGVVWATYKCKMKNSFNQKNIMWISSQRFIKLK